MSKMSREELERLVQQSGVEIKRLPEAPRPSNRELSRTGAEGFFEKCARWQKKSYREEQRREQRRRTKRLFVEGRL
jgi:hypothetical protein